VKLQDPDSRNRNSHGKRNPKTQVSKTETWGTHGRSNPGYLPSAMGAGGER
jgi:hypothetical protein